MALRNDRVGELLEGDYRKRKALISPEGVSLNIKIAGNGERVKALALDLLFMLTAIIIIFIIFLVAVSAKFNIYVTSTIFMLLFFIIRNMYFIHFELAWQGRTPGKKICGLRVINRSGGELTPGAVIARNLTREVELFLPISLFFSIFGDGLLALAVLGWVLVLTCLPLFNREHLRAGDLIGGTMVISMPKRALLGDLTLAPSILVNTANVNPNVTQNDALTRHYAFSHEQLSFYGAFELQVLEEFLRRPPSAETESILTEICAKICTKINWREPVARAEVRRFLNDFYAAERAELERGQLFGKLREDKTHGVQKTYPNATQSDAPVQHYAFSHEQLSVYGASELQILENFLRRPPSVETESTLAEICAKICTKISWREPVARAEVRRFLNNFYAATRAELKRGQLAGKLREDKSQDAQKTYPKSPVI